MHRAARRVALRAAAAALTFLAWRAPPAAAEPEDAEWIRWPAISPDGKEVAFTWRGDLWVVPSAGGDARLLTTHVGHERSAVWSPDGRFVAFASDRHGQFDVFVVPAVGGESRRLTWHSAHDIPSSFTPDGASVVFSSTRQDAPEALLSSQWLPELWTVPVAGGRPRQLLTTAAEAAVPSPDGSRWLYQDRKAYEDAWRKHHTSSAARDVWMWTPGTGRHVKLTDFAGEDRNPAWLPGGATFAFLSERGSSSCFNVWRQEAAPGAAPVQVSRHAMHPARFLTAAKDGTLCWSWHGQLWTARPGAEPSRVAVRCAPSDRANPEFTDVARSGATEMCPSPNGDEVAIVVRGDVYVASSAHGTTRRITATPGMERSVSWDREGKALWYAAERGGSWNVYRAAPAAADARLWNAATIREEAVIATAAEEFQPVVSPDGASVAFLRDRDEICVLDTATRQVKGLVPASRNYSYADGDIRYSWSPDSKWLAFTFIGRARWIDDLGAAEVASGRIVNVTDSGYEEGVPEWTADGRALLFVSDRLGRRAHGSWGSDADVFAQHLTQASFDRSRLSQEEFDLLRKAEEKAKEGQPSGATPAAAPRVTFEEEGRERRIRRVSTISAPVGNYASSPDGELVVLFAEIDGEWSLWGVRPRSGEQKKLLSVDGPGDVWYAKDGKSLFVRTGSGAVFRAELSGTEHDGNLSATRKDVAYAAEVSVDLRLEREGIFDHAWRQAKAKFYDPKLHGVDWERMRDEYRRMLPHAANNHEFVEILSEMLGELNASHTGGRYRFSPADANRTAGLGVLWDLAWTGEGMRVAEVLAAGPADRPGTKLAPGAVVLAVDGVPFAASEDPARPLNRKAGKTVTLTIRTASGETVEERAKAVDPGEEAGLLHMRWERRCRAEVDRLSGGKLGWVHVDGMDEGSYRTVFRDVLGRESDKEGLVVDTRWNGGGWLHDDLVRFLGGKDYLWFVPRGKAKGDLGAEPARRWTRPSVVLMNEGNYSDAHVFPFAFRELGVGKLVGTPVAGTGTAVWWETQVDPSLVFGIPQVGLVDARGSYLENQELLPDIDVRQDPAEIARGRDEQLEAAVRALLAK
ncbi:MAG: Tricorn protease [Planctomycetes bacterium]|nr:Tricorn protease [Planctomycetota bacterium]